MLQGLAKCIPAAWEVVSPLCIKYFKKLKIEVLYEYKWITSPAKLILTVVLNQFLGKHRKGKTFKLGSMGKSLNGIIFMKNKAIHVQIV